jgi:hypothetical protein
VSKVRKASVEIVSPAARSRRAWALFAPVILLLLSALLVASASADERIAGLPGQFSPDNGPAVSQKEGGDIYELEGNAAERVAAFKPNGEFVRAFGWGIVPGAATGTGDVTVGSTKIIHATTTSGSFYASGFGGGGATITGPGIPPNTRITSIGSAEIQLSQPALASGSDVALTVTAGPGNVPTNEVQKLTVRATSGTYELRFETTNPGSTSATTGAIPAGATHEEVEAALEGLSNIESGDVAVSGGPGDAKGTNPYLIEFKGRYADANVRSLSIANSSLGGGFSEAAISTPTEGGGVVETCTTSCIGESTEENREFGQGNRGGQLRYPDALAIDNDPTSSSYGDVYVVDQRSYRIAKYSPTGQLEMIMGSDVIAQGPGNSANDEVQKLSVAAEGGTFQLELSSPSDQGGFHQSRETVAMPYNATAEEVEKALDALPLISGFEGFVSTTVTGGPGNATGSNPYEITFEGEVAGDDITQLVPLSAGLSGAAHIAEVETLSNGGGPEACKPAIGDVCKVGAPGTGPGQFYDSEPTVFNPTGEWGNEGHNSIAIAPGGTTGGTVYVGDFDRVQEFEPDGTYIGQLTLGDSQPKFIGALAVDSSGNIFERSADYQQGGQPMLSQIPGVREYSKSHVYVRTFDAGSEEAGSEPTHIAVDASGNLFVSDQNSEVEESSLREFAFRAFHPSGALYAEFTSDQVSDRGDVGGNTVPGTARASGIAIGDAAERLYATSFNPEGQHIAVVPLPQIGAPTTEKEVVSDLEPTTATLHALVNPRGSDTEYHFEYVDEGSFNTENGFASPNTVSTASFDLGLVARNDAVLTAISGLIPGTAYRWRVVAESAEGTTYGPAEFTTLTPISVREFTTQEVGPELVKLKAELNPNGQASTYTFRIGEDANYGTGESEGQLPIGNEFIRREATFTGLKPNTEYHYQLVGENGYGQLETADRTFVTEPSAAEELQAENCPNGRSSNGSKSTLREENNSVFLPDCRAYEKTTITHKEGGEAFQTAGASRSGERVLYYSEGVFGGAEQNELAIQYVAQRTETGWTTQAVVRRLAPSPTEPLAAIGLFSPEVDRWLYMEGQGSSAEEALGEQDSSYFSMGGVNGNYVLHASPTLAPVENGKRFIFNFMEVGGLSSDLSRVFIRTGSRLLPAPGDPRPDSVGGIPGHPGGSNIPPEADRIYELAGVGGPSPTIRLAAEVPLGLTANGGTFSGGGCYIDDSRTEGMRVGEKPRYTNEEGTLLFYTAPFELAAGANCGPGEPNPYGLFVRHGESPPVQLNVPFHCTAPHPCATAGTGTPRYDGASADGSHVWFTTSQPLVNADEDSTNDVYVATVGSNGELVNLQQASAGEGTSSHPTAGVGALVGEDGIEEGSEGNNQGMARVSEDGSHAAFESPAVLTEEPNSLGQSAVQHANNLYEYDASTGELKFVAELCSGPNLSGSEKAGVEAVNSHPLTARNGVPDPACPANVSPYIDSFIANGGNDSILWEPGSGRSTMSSNGKDLLFTSWGQLAPDDTDTALDMYRYDFPTGELVRVSKGRNGNDGNGNDDAFPAEFAGSSGSLGDPSPLAEDSARAISADGSTVIFRTAASLVSHDTNATPHATCGQFEEEGQVAVHGTGCDIYEWEEEGHGTCTEPGGCVRLVSSGLAPQGDSAAVISTSGRDIIFHTLRNMIPEDTDGIGDVYDARVDGGFHAPHPPAPCGSPEACRSSEPPPAGPVVATPGFFGSGNEGQRHLKCGKGRHRAIRHNQVRCVASRHRKPRRHAHKGSHGRPAGRNLGGGK